MLRSLVCDSVVVEKFDHMLGVATRSDVHELMLSNFAVSFPHLWRKAESQVHRSAVSPTRVHLCQKLAHRFVLAGRDSKSQRT